jgi:tetratricopeptide (TPR) repeat protein
MELFTNILIWVGFLTAVVVVVLTLYEFVWKPGQEGRTAVERPIALGKVKDSAAAGPVDSDPSVERSTDQTEVPNEVDQADDGPKERFKRLIRSQRLLLARLTTMATDFDREAGLAVAACKDVDFDAVVQTGLVELDEGTSRYSLTESGRALGAEYLTPEDDKLVRQFHTEHFTRLVEHTHESDISDREAAVLGFEMVQAEWPHLEAVLEFITSEDDHEHKVLEFAEAVNATGILQSRPNDGLRWYEIMLAAERKLSNREKELDSLGSLGAIYAKLENPSKALECFTQGANIARELDDHQGEGSCLGNMGVAWQNLGDTEKAVECFDRTLVIMRETGDAVREGFALASLGKAAEDSGDNMKAIDYYEQHLKLAVESGDPGGEMLALAHIGGAYLAEGAAPEAVNRFERQLKLAKSLNDIAAEGNARGNLGRSYRMLGNHDKAAEHFDRQVEFAHTLNDPSLGLRALGELGQSHQDANRTWKAVECFDDQLKLARQVGNRESEALALWSAARAVRSLGRTPDAITRISAALAILESIESPELERARADLEKWRIEKS